MDRGLRALEEGMEILRQKMQQSENGDLAGLSALQEGMNQLRLTQRQLLSGGSFYKANMRGVRLGNIRGAYGQPLGQRGAAYSSPSGDSYSSRPGPFDPRFARSRSRSPSYGPRRSRSPVNCAVPERRSRPYHRSGRVHPYERLRPHNPSRQSARRSEEQDVRQRGRGHLRRDDLRITHPRRYVSSSIERRSNPNDRGDRYSQQSGRTMQEQQRLDASQDARGREARDRYVDTGLELAQEEGEQSLQMTSGIRERDRHPYAWSGTRS